MTIKEVSEKYDVSADTIRYYERIGLIPHVPRKANGIREFDEASCGWVEFIKCMRGAGVQVEALIEYVSLFFQEGTEAARKDILVEQRARLQEQLETLQSLQNIPAVRIWKNIFLEKFFLETTVRLLQRQ